MSAPTFIEVEGYFFDEPEHILVRTFGRVPEDYYGWVEQLEGDNLVSFWLDCNEPLVVGQEYGDFVVTEVLT